MSSFWLNLNTNEFHSPNYHDLMLITKSLILAETPINTALLSECEFIEKNTDDELKIPLSVIELAIYKNFGKGFEAEIEIYGHSLTIADLHRYANKVLSKLTKIVTEISKRYSLEIVFKTPETKLGSIGELKIG